MPNEKQNNPRHWINKLDEPDSLPAEEMVDKNEAWKKLHQRLSGKPRKNKMIWYWAAAACLTIAFSLPMILAKKNVKSIVKDVSQKNKKEQQAIANSSSMPERTSTEVENVLTIKKKEGNPVIRKRIHNNLHAGNTSVKQILSDADSKNAKATPQQLTINTVTSADTASSMIAAFVPLKKKMRVVHINELENAEDGIASSVTDHQQSTFSMSFGNNTQPTKQTSPARDYAGIFKIKISSKN